MSTEPTQPITAADAAGDLVGAMPTVNENAVAASAPAETPAAAPSLAPVLDKLGRTFDAAKFRANPDGSPRLDTAGRFIPLHLGRKPANAQRETNAIPQSFIPDDPQPAKLDPVSVTAETAIGVIQTALIMLGEEEGVLSEMEKMMLRPPLERVLKKYDVGEMPAELDLAVALAGIVISRMSRPKTQGKLERLKMWLVGKIADHRGARRASAIREATATIQPAAQ